MRSFPSPGQADPGIDAAALTAWNDLIRSRLSEGDPGTVLRLAAARGEAALPPDPGPAGAPMAWRVVRRPDADGVPRPKRLVVTTELMEWWRTMAVHDLDHFLGVVRQVTGTDHSAEELFALRPEVWRVLPVAARQRIFRRRLVGMAPGTPPEHPLNADHALFVPAGIGARADLPYVIQSGARAYAVRDDDPRHHAPLSEIFALVRRGEARSGARALRFAAPPGIYMRGIAAGDLFVDGRAVPQGWERFGRGQGGLSMRLVYGPGDDEPEFLDDIRLGPEADADAAVLDDLLRAIEIAPLVLLSQARVDLPEAAPTDAPCPAGAEPSGRTLAADYDLVARLLGQLADPAGPHPDTRGHSGR